MALRVVIVPTHRRALPIRRVDIGQLEALQLDVDGSELLSQKKCLMLASRGTRLQP